MQRVAPRVITRIAELRDWRRELLLNREKLGFVPTMGALHSGHLDLVEKSLSMASRTIVSIFVNPAQFAPNEDLDSYPRTLESDLQKLGSRVDVVFAPSVNEMYPRGITTQRSSQVGTFVEVLGYSHQLEGLTRPHFFRGVATVVSKLANIVQPDFIYFGQKDIQQAVVLERMFTDLHFNLKMVISPTVRAEDGLALSSRNVYLSTEQRRLAPCLYQALSEMKRLAQHGDKVGKLKQAAIAIINEAAAKATTFEIKIDYIECVDPRNLQPFPDDTVVNTNSAILVGAIFNGTTRLIDNLVLGDLQKLVGS